MIDKPDMSWADWKTELAKYFYKVTDHPEYRNKTYTGKDFWESLMAWEDAWFGLLYHSFELKDLNTYEDPFKYKFYRWTLWNHNFNGRSFRMRYGINGDWTQPFEYPEFLVNMFDLTYQFLGAKTREEESKVFDTTYMIDYIGKDKFGKSKYEVVKYIWLSEENTGTKSEYLPVFAPYDLTKQMRGKKLYNYYRHMNDHEPNGWKWKPEEIDKFIAEAKDRWRVFRIAVKKGLLIDNHGKDR